jgi:hypothetical protein
VKEQPTNSANAELAQAILAQNAELTQTVLAELSGELGPDIEHL